MRILKTNFAPRAKIEFHDNARERTYRMLKKNASQHLFNTTTWPAFQNFKRMKNNKCTRSVVHFGKYFRTL